MKVPVRKGGGTGGDLEIGHFFTGLVKGKPPTSFLRSGRRTGSQRGTDARSARGEEIGPSSYNLEDFIRGTGAAWTVKSGSNFRKG